MLSMMRAVQPFHLHFDAGRLMLSERTGQVEAMYEVLGQNLQRCTKLKELSVKNVGVGRSNDSWLFSVSLLQALVPSLSRRQSDLTSLKVTIGGISSDPTYERHLAEQETFVMVDFFVAVLEMKSLLTLEIEICNNLDHLDALIQAARTIKESHQIQKPTTLTNLKIWQQSGAEGRNNISIDTSAECLLDYFSGCDRLRALYLALPSEQWVNCYFALRGLLFDKPELESVSLCFSCYHDVDDAVMKTLVDFCQQSTSSLKELSVFGLFSTRSDDFQRLQDWMAEKGMFMSRCREKFGEKPEELDLLICTFVREDDNN